MTPTDQFVEYAQRIGRLHLVDLRRELLAASQTQQVYFALDTHWNSRGALVGSRAILRELQPYRRDLQLIPLDEYRVVAGSHTHCDLARMLNLPMVESSERLVHRNSHLVMGPPQPGGLQRAEAPAAPPGTLFVLGDSFFLGAWQYVGPYFRESILASWASFPTQEIESQRPEIVVHEFVERSLPALAFENPHDVSPSLERELLAKRPGSLKR